MNIDQLIADALKSASDTKFLRCAAGARHEVAEIFGRPDLFGNQPAIIVADETTYSVAGLDVFDGFRRSGMAVAEPFIFGPDVYAEDRCVQQLQSAIQNVRGMNLQIRTSRPSGTDTTPSFGSIVQNG